MKILFTSAAITFAATAAMAQTADLSCKFNSGDTRIMPPAISASLNYASGKARVGMPGSEETTLADISEDSSSRLSITWEELVPDRRGTYAKLAFRLVHFKKNGRGLLRVDAIGFDNQYTARGACRLAK